MDKELLFSITKKDFEIETFHAGGKGGQNQNKRNTGVRVRHIKSGLFAEGRDERTQEQNLKNAFNRLVSSEKFQRWLKIETSKRLGEFVEIEKEVDKMLNPINLRIEVMNENGKWVKEI